MLARQRRFFLGVGPTMFNRCPHSKTRRLSALTAAVFGILTMIAGGRILLGLGEAGYTVVRPVLIFNTAMGVLYLIAAILIVRDFDRGWMLASFIAVANLTVLAVIVVSRAAGGAVANETLAAMTLRTLVWLVIAILLGRERRPRAA